MSRFFDHLDSGYLPGEVRRSTYGEASPFSALTYELGKRFKFKPKSDMAGRYMKEFSALSDNPNFLINSSIQLPGDFTGMMNFLSQNQ
jgi:hypothetical protein